jgi:hypothetical protein
VQPLALPTAARPAFGGDLFPVVAGGAVEDCVGLAGKKPKQMKIICILPSVNSTVLTQSFLNANLMLISTAPNHVCR